MTLTTPLPVAGIAMASKMLYATRGKVRGEAEKGA